MDSSTPHKNRTNENPRHPAKTAAGIKHFPRKHLLVVGALAVSLTLLLALFPSKPVSAKRQEIKVDINLPIVAGEEDPDTLSTTIDDPVTQTSLTEKTIRVKSGDNLSLLFQRAGLTNHDVYKFTHKNPDAKALKRIHPGHQLTFRIDADNQLQELHYVEDRLHSTLFRRQDNGFETVKEIREPDTHLAYREAQIDNSLFLAGQAAGLEASLTMELANIFGWDIDFALDIRKGDSFKLLFEEKFLDGEKIGNGAILAAQFTNQGKTFKAVRYTNTADESHYYTPAGKSMRKAFLRAPLDFRRISSNFNPRRLHPIYKTVRPHRGTDYAASRGTPVYASGSGRVIASAYTKANGNYVVIQHSNNIQTKYLHLNKRKVRKGQRVAQKQLIGTVGTTGYSTAPHLHYEFLLNGVHRNPRTILQKLPKAKSVPESERVRFFQQTQPILAQLDAYHQSTQLAAIDFQTAAFAQPE